MLININYIYIVNSKILNDMKKSIFSALCLVLLATTTQSAWGETWTKITSTSELTDGDYLIVYEGESGTGALAFDGSLTTLDAVSNTQSVTISSSSITLDAKYCFTIAQSGSNYTIKSASGYSIGQTSNANGLKSSNSNTYTNSISFSDGTANIVSSGAYLRYNTTSDQLRFRYYKSSSYTAQKAICLYKKSGSTEPTVYLGLFLAAFVAVRACVRRVECLYATFHHIIMSKIDFRSVHFAKALFVLFFLVLCCFCR